MDPASTISFFFKNPASLTPPPRPQFSSASRPVRADSTAALVVGKNLGADPLARWLGELLPAREVGKAASAKGFRVLEIGPES